MKNILLLSFADFRKNKSQAISLFIFVLIAAMFMNIGLVLFLGMETFFDERAEANNSAHFWSFYSAPTDSIDEGLRYLKNYPGVTETESVDIVGGNGEITLNDAKTFPYLLLSPVYEHQKMDAPSMVGDYLPLTGDAIYIPNFMMLGGGYELGNEFKLLLSETEHIFTVAGATEEIMFGSQFNTMYRLYISDEKFARINDQSPELAVTLISARLENIDDDIFLSADFNKDVSADGLYWILTIADARSARTMVPMIAAIVVTVFSFILLAVCLIVIRFRISNSIEESMTNIGAQKAVGFRSVQIISAIVMLFSGIALIGVCSGIAAANAAVPIIMNILEPMIALQWNPGFDTTSAIASLLLIVLAVSLISFLSARKISRLHPLIALRGGIKTHSFKKNTLPLDKTRGPLDLLLALKQLIRKKGQAAAIGIIIAAVTMASVAGIAVNHNMNDGSDGFARAVFGEMPDAVFMLQSGEDSSAFAERLLQRKEVRKAFGYEPSVLVLVDETQIAATIVQDCSLLEGAMLVDGRYPRHSNEIALGSPIMTVAGKGIGDSIIVRVGENEKECIVTGMIQFMNMGGFNGIMTENALVEIQPDFAFTSLSVYLNDGESTSDLIESVRAEEGSTIETAADVLDSLKVTMDSMSGIFAAVAAGVGGVTVFVVILVLYMVIKTTILNRKRELGIQKALGFTTLRLMNQIALNMTPIVLLGVIIGGTIGYFGFDTMMAATMINMGIVKVDLPVPLVQLIIACIALVVLAYCISMLIAWRIRKISAYSLVTE